MKFNHEKAQEMMNFLLEKDIKYFTKLRKTFELKLSKDLNTSEVAKVLEPMREEDKMVALELLYRGIDCNDNLFDKLYSQLETLYDDLSTDDSFDINTYKATFVSSQKTSMFDSKLKVIEFNKDISTKGYDLKLLKKNITTIKCNSNDTSTKELKNISPAEEIYNSLVDDEFNNLKSVLVKIPQMETIDTSGAYIDILIGIAKIIKENNYAILSETYPRDIDVFETITNKLDLMGEDTSYLYDVNI